MLNVKSKACCCFSFYFFILPIYKFLNEPSNTIHRCMFTSAFASELLTGGLFTNIGGGTGLIAGWSEGCQGCSRSLTTSWPRLCESCQCLAVRRWSLPGNPVSSTTLSVLRLHSHPHPSQECVLQKDRWRHQHYGSPFLKNELNSA